MVRSIIVKYCLLINKSRRLRWAGHVVRMEEGRSAFKILTGKPTKKRPLGRPRRSWDNSIRMDFKEIYIKSRNWVDSAQDRGLLESPCECGIQPLSSISHGVSFSYKELSLFSYSCFTTTFVGKLQDSHFA